MISPTKCDTDSRLNRSIGVYCRSFRLGCISVKTEIHPDCSQFQYKVLDGH